MGSILSNLGTILTVWKLLSLSILFTQKKMDRTNGYFFYTNFQCVKNEFQQKMSIYDRKHSAGSIHLINASEKVIAEKLFLMNDTITYVL